jgi:peroxiredoxin
MKKIITFVLFSLSLIMNAQEVADKPENISPLLIGEKIPNINLQNTNSETVATDKLFEKKTVVIVYRGGWCPYCNAQLADMQKIETAVVNLGYQIVAISPDAPAFLKESLSKEKLNYQLLSDSNGNFSKTIGIAFTTPEKYASMLGKYSEGKNTNWLPVPTVYVVNEKGIIEFMYINPNYDTRLNGQVLLAVLKNL